MSYITAQLLERELQRLHVEAGGDPAATVHVSETRTQVRFRARIGDRTVDFSVPEDALHNAPLSHVSDTYLRPLSP